MKKSSRVVSLLIIIAMMVTFLPVLGIQTVAASNIVVFQAENTTAVNGTRQVMSDRIVCDRDKNIMDYCMVTPGQTIAPGTYRILLFANLLTEMQDAYGSILKFDIYGDDGTGMKVMKDAWVLRSQFSMLNKFQTVMIQFSTTVELTNAQLRFNFNKNASVEIDKFAVLSESDFYENQEAESIFNTTVLPTGSVKSNEGVLIPKGISQTNLFLLGTPNIPAGAQKVVMHMKMLEKSGYSDNVLGTLAMWGTPTGGSHSSLLSVPIVEPNNVETNQYFNIEFILDRTVAWSAITTFLSLRATNCTFEIDRIEFTSADFDTSIASSNTSTYEAEVSYSQSNTRSITADGQAVECNPSTNDAGAFIFGTNLTFVPGTYKVTAVMKINGRTANPNDKFAYFDTYGNVAGANEKSNETAIRDVQFSQLDTWTNVDIYFKTAQTMSNVQLRMFSLDRIDFKVDKFIIQKLDDTASVILQAYNSNGNLSGTMTNEGIKCEVGNPADWATHSSDFILDPGKYNILIHVKQLQQSIDAYDPIFTFQLSYKKAGVSSSSYVIFTQNQFPSTVGEYKAFSVPIEVAQGERFTSTELMVRFEGETDIIIDKFEIMPAVTLGIYKVTNNIITNLNPGTTTQEFNNQILPIGVSSSFNAPLAASGKIGTGTIVNVTLNGYTQTYATIIYGDVTGDGLVALEDLVSIRNDLLEVNPLEGVFKTAGNLYGENDITLNDLVGIMAAVSESEIISQNPQG